MSELTTIPRLYYLQNPQRQTPGCSADAITHRKLHPVGNAPGIILLVTIQVCEFVIVTVSRPEHHVTITSRARKEAEGADTNDIPAIGCDAESSSGAKLGVKAFPVRGGGAVYQPIYISQSRPNTDVSQLNLRYRNGTF